MALDPEGVVPLVVGSRTLKLKFGFRAIKEVERHFKQPFAAALTSIIPAAALAENADEAQLAGAALDLDFTAIGKLAEFALLRYQPDIAETDVEEIFDEVGIEGVLGAVMTAVQAALSAGEKKEAGAAAPNPPKPRRGR